jgi:hypothetical protein
MFKITLLLLPFFSLPALPVCAQTGREVVYRELGISFHIPEGWNGEERDEAFLMSSPSEAGIILLLPHEYTALAEIREEAERGIRDEGISLQLEGPLETLGEHGLGGRFSGMLSGRMARAYIVGLINPHGQGFSIMAAADTAGYSDRLRELALAVAGSTRFFQPESASAVQYWKTELQNIRLYWSYSSTSRVGGYSGMSETEEIWLCGAGYFHYKSSSHNSFDSGGPSATAAEGVRAPAHGRSLTTATGVPSCCCVFKAEKSGITPFKAWKAASSTWAVTNTSTVGPETNAPDKSPIITLLIAQR